MNMRFILLALFSTAAYAGNVREKEIVLTTGANSNAAASVLIEQGLLESVKVDVASSGATGDVTVAIQGKVSTESDESIVSLTANTADTTVVPVRWVTTAAGVAQGATTTAYTNTIIGYNGTTAVTNSWVGYYATTAASPSKYVLCDNVITSSVTSTITGKTWRIIVRWIEP
jgi:hypothetical protein